MFTSNSLEYIKVIFNKQSVWYIFWSLTASKPKKKCQFINFFQKSSYQTECKTSMK